MPLAVFFTHTWDSSDGESLEFDDSAWGLKYFIDKLCLTNNILNVKKSIKK